MKKKFLALMLVVAMAVGVAGCGGNASAPTTSSSLSETESKAEEEPAKQKEEKPSVLEGLPYEEIEDAVNTDVEETISALTAEYESLVAEIDSYEKYKENIEAVRAFYEKIFKETASLCIRLREYGLNYGQAVIASGSGYRDMYDDIEIIYDVIYEDAGDEIYDEIYDGILDDMYDDFYDGIIEDGYDIDAYKTYSDIRSDEYDMWSGCKSDVYDEWSDMKSDIYDFWSDMRGEIYDDDMERAQKKIDKFISDIEKLKEE